MKCFNPFPPDVVNSVGVGILHCGRDAMRSTPIHGPFLGDGVVHWGRHGSCLGLLAIDSIRFIDQHGVAGLEGNWVTVLVIISAGSIDP